MASPSTCLISPAPEQTPTHEAVPLCPACGGQLLLLRSLWRCPRCHYSICDGCEGGTQDIESHQELEWASRNGERRHTDGPNLGGASKGNNAAKRAGLGRRQELGQIQLAGRRCRPELVLELKHESPAYLHPGASQPTRSSSRLVKRRGGPRGLRFLISAHG